jgi:hypothetical protein
MLTVGGLLDGVVVSVYWSIEAMLASSWRAPAAGRNALRRSICAGVSSMASAAVFSSTRATRRVPGMGAMSSPRVRIQASAVCAGVTPISAPMAVKVLAGEPGVGPTPVVVGEVVDGAG